MTELENSYIERLQEENEELIKQLIEQREELKTQAEVIQRLQSHSCKHCIRFSFDLIKYKPGEVIK
jgi:hypothetical protein